jgi:hypothetical protein
MPARRAGQHARTIADTRKRRLLATLALLFTADVVVAVVTRLDPIPILAASAITIAVTKLLERSALPTLERWSRGATGEENVGALLDAMRTEGWFAVYDVNTGRGNIDAIVVGPGGLFTVEVKSHGGRIAVDNIDAAMLAQSYAQKKWLERITGRQVTSLLVFSRAYLVGRPVSRQRGVTVLPARMLAGHLQRYRPELGADDAATLHKRLTAALEPLDAAA